MTDGFSERDFLGFVLSQLGDVEGAATQIERAIRSSEAQARQLTAGSEPARLERLARARLHYAAGGLLVNSRLDDLAEPHFLAAIELEPALSDARIKLGNLLARRGELERAVDAYGTVLDLDAVNAAALLKRGAALMALERTTEAAVDLERVVDIEPGNSEALLRLANVRSSLGDASSSERLLRRALELDLEPRELGAAHYELGRLAMRSGDLEDAVRSFDAARAADPALHDAHFQAATVLGRQRRYEQAAAAYRQLIELDAGHELARLGEATALVLLGLEAEAVASLSEGVLVLPASLAITHTLARLLASASDRSVRDGPRAVELATQAVTAVSSLEHAETLAMALAQDGRYDEAAQLQRRLIAEADTRGDTRVLARLRLHLELYENQSACCDAR